MTSYGPPRLSSHPSNQPDSASGRGAKSTKNPPTWVPSAPLSRWAQPMAGWPALRDTIPMHHHQRSGDGTTEWKRSPQHRGLQESDPIFIRSSYFTSISGHATSGLSVGWPTLASISSPRLPTLPSVSLLRLACAPLWTKVCFIGSIV
jgi:hypothetical protein